MVIIQSTIWWYLWVDIYPSTKHMWSCQPFCQWRHPCPLHIAWKLHPSSGDAPVDINRRNHSFPFIHPREVFLAWCWVIARLLSSWLGLTGVGLVHPSHAWWTLMHRGMPVSDTMRRSQLWCRMCDFHAGLSFHMRGHLLQSDVLPHEACPPICPWSSFSLERCLPWLGWDCQVSILWHLFSSHSTAFVSEPLS